MHTKNHTAHKNSNTKIHKANIIQNQKSLPGPYIRQRKTNKPTHIRKQKATNVHKPTLIAELGLIMKLYKKHD